LPRRTSIESGMSISKGKGGNNEDIAYFGELADL
jgi:hypothetical protein